jgi:periplasmic glucans biosynthesis protein
LTVAPPAAKVARRGTDTDEIETLRQRRQIARQGRVRTGRSRPVWRRASLGVIAAMLCVAGGAGRADAAKVFGLDSVAAKAKKLAAAPYKQPETSVPDWLLKISYDQWRDIRFRPERALWRDGGSPFQVQFFHPGLFYNQAVTIHVVDSTGVHLVQFSPSQFDYGANDFASKVPQDLGYAGFRLHYPIKRADYFDEVIVFLGASYFRAVGKREGFGASARGLAIDTALPSGEEFPAFREFWLARPAAGDRDMAFYALLDSPSMAGAYRFVVDPGEQTIVKVEARLFPRRKVQKVGLAPLTSMFYVGENTLQCPLDYRPEVHDSDGLLLQLGTGEWLWRPLDNPTRLQVSRFEAKSLQGFGLLQYDRDFDHYQDLEARPDQRPSVWIGTVGDWGDGAVELVEIPTSSDVNDNVVAYWVPKTPLEPGKPFTIAYTMTWYGEDRMRPPGGHAVATRRDHNEKKNKHRFVIDFASKQLDQIPTDAVLRGVVTLEGPSEDGEVTEQQVVKNPFAGGWRLTFQVRTNTDEPVELRAFLDRNGEALTETWTYVIAP